MPSYTFLASTLYCPQPCHWYAALSYTWTHENGISISIVYSCGICQAYTSAVHMHGIYMVYTDYIPRWVPDVVCSGRMTDQSGRQAWLHSLTCKSKENARRYANEKRPNEICACIKIQICYSCLSPFGCCAHVLPQRRWWSLAWSGLLRRNPTDQSKRLPWLDRVTCESMETARIFENEKRLN